MAAAAPAQATYKAWTFRSGGYPGCLSQTTHAAPTNATPLSPTQLLVRVRSAALNPFDIQLVNLALWSLPGLGRRAKGVGADFAGTVVRAGAASGFGEGDAVFGLHMPTTGREAAGTVAEVLLLDAARAGGDVVLRKPPRWDWNHAAALPLVWLTARTCVACVEGYVGPRGTLVVLGGSSATGMYVVHLARERGWTVVATCSARNAEFVRGMGADEVVDYTSAEVRKEVERAKPDAIVDCVGGTECLRIAKRYVTIVGDKTDRSAMGGSLVYLWNPQMVWRWLLGKIGWGEVYDCIILDGKKEYLEEATKLPTDKIIIDSTFSFDQLKEALDRLHTGRVRGKVVVEIDKS